MITKNHLIILGWLLVISCSSPQTNIKDQQSALDSRVDSLLQLMTVEEKIGQLNLYNGFFEFTGPVPENNSAQEKLENIKAGRVGGMLNVLSAEETRAAQKWAVENSRLGIPLIFGYDVIHGYKTMLPIPLAQAASWDPEVARSGAAIAAREAASAGLNWTFSPMIDVSRDARWGRIMEGAGEDPYLTSVMAKAWVQGYQGDDLTDPFTIAACAKHFAGYAFAEAARDYNTVDINRQTLFNVVFPPFKAAVDAGAATFMTSFNDLEGVPAAANPFIGREILKERWGFDGLVVTDWGTIKELITHGYVEDSLSASIAAMKGGSDMDMESRIYERFLQDAIDQGAVDLKSMDDAVARILRVKFELGLFEDPYRYSDSEREKINTLTPENLEGARDAARKSIVLLKNEGDLLPLSPDTKSIAVIGQLAGSKDIPLGNWRGKAVENSAVSLVEGIEAASSGKVSFAEGYTLTTGRRTFIHELTFADDDKSGFKAAISLARNADVVVMAMGEDCYQSGEARSQADIGLKGTQMDLLKEILKVNKNVVVVLMNGRPLAIPELAETVPAIVETWHGGSEAGNAIADVLFGSYNPSGKLPVSFPYHVGQEPLHYDRKNTGRPMTNAFDDGLVFWSHYTDVPNEAVFPFGYGLSYSKFEYADLAVDVQQANATVQIKLTNQSQVDGKETVQVYIRDVTASEVQPIIRLVDYKQVQLKAGESSTLSFELTEEELGFYHGLDGKFFAEDGEFDIMVGANSRDVMKERVRINF